MLEASSAVASMFGRVENPGDLGGNVRAAVQMIWQHMELSFKLPRVNVLVIQVVNFSRDLWSIICSRIRQSNHESGAKAW